MSNNLEQGHAAARIDVASHGHRWAADMHSTMVSRVIDAFTTGYGMYLKEYYEQ